MSTPVDCYAAQRSWFCMAVSLLFSLPRPVILLLRPGAVSFLSDIENCNITLDCTEPVQCCLPPPLANLKLYTRPQWERLHWQFTSTLLHWRWAIRTHIVAVVSGIRTGWAATAEPWNAMHLSRKQYTMWSCGRGWSIFYAQRFSFFVFICQFVNVVYAGYPSQLLFIAHKCFVIRILTRAHVFARPQFQCSLQCCWRCYAR